MSCVYAGCSTQNISSFGMGPIHHKCNFVGQHALLERAGRTFTSSVLFYSFMADQLRTAAEDRSAQEDPLRARLRATSEFVLHSRKRGAANIIATSPDRCDAPLLVALAEAEADVALPLAPD